MLTYINFFPDASAQYPPQQQGGYPQQQGYPQQGGYQQGGFQQQGYPQQQGYGAPPPMQQQRALISSME